jgi:hypothetical protein
VAALELLPPSKNLLSFGIQATLCPLVEKDSGKELVSFRTHTVIMSRHVHFPAHGVMAMLLMQETKSLSSVCFAKAWSISEAARAALLQFHAKRSDDLHLKVKILLLVK